jgi:hypothetical protein
LAPDLRFERTKQLVVLWNRGPSPHSEDDAADPSRVVVHEAQHRPRPTCSRRERLSLHDAAADGGDWLPLMAAESRP